MISFKKLIILKTESDILIKKINKIFTSLKNKCEYRKLKYHDRDYRQEWYKCTHEDYRFIEYTSITPCSHKQCPKLN